jgi:ribosomal protein S18 acetylase RimI-like enzyme
MLMIRPATPADHEAVESIVRAAYSVYITRIGKAPGPMLHDYKTLIQQERVYVLDDNGGVTGLVVLIPEARTMLLDNVAVSPEVHGKGYGRRLIAFAEEEARRQGFEMIRLYTNLAMTENLSLYDRLGYTETHRAEENGFSRVYMEKRFGKHEL